MRVLRIVAAGLAGCVLLALVVLRGMTAAALERGDVGSAMALRPASGAAAGRAATAALAANDLPRAESLAVRALVVQPRDVVASRVLGFARLLQGDAAGGTPFMLNAAALSWRDNPTQMWLIGQAVAAGDIDTATQRIDAMLRREERSTEMFDLLHRMTAVPAMRPAVAGRLAEMPTWRRNFFYKLDILRPEQFGGHAQLIADLRASEGPLRRSEIVPFLNRLVNADRYAEARTVWNANLLPAERVAMGIADGSFTIAARMRDPEAPTAPFEWSLTGDAGAYASVGTPPMMATETALSASSAGGGQGVVAEQTLALPSGTHRLSYDTIVGDGMRPDGFAWTLRCRPSNGLVASRMVADRRVGAWQRRQLRLDVPAANCPGQRLQLVTTGRGGGERVEAWFDNLSLD